MNSKRNSKLFSVFFSHSSLTLVFLFRREVKISNIGIRIEEHEVDPEEQFKLFSFQRIQINQRIKQSSTVELKHLLNELLIKKIVEVVYIIATVDLSNQHQNSDLKG